MENQFTIYKNFAIISDFAYCENGCKIGEIIEGTDYKLLSYKSDNGFQAGLFENIKTKEKIISVRGTDNPLSKKIFYNPKNVLDDVINDISVGITGESWQTYQLQIFYNNLVKQGFLNENEQIIICGHSLGGYLTQIFALNNSKLIKQAYTFNSLGIGGLIGSGLKLADKDNFYNEKITNIIAKDGMNFAINIGIRAGKDILISGKTHGINDMIKTLEFYEFATEKGVKKDEIDTFLTQMARLKNKEIPQIATQMKAKFKNRHVKTAMELELANARKMNSVIVFDNKATMPSLDFPIKQNADFSESDPDVYEFIENLNANLQKSQSQTPQNSNQNDKFTNLQNSQNSDFSNLQTSHSQQTPQLQNTCHSEPLTRHSELSQESEESHMNSQNIRHSEQSEESQRNLQNSQTSQNTPKWELTFTEKYVIKDFAHKLYGVKMPEIKQRIGIDAATQCKISFLLDTICEHKRQIVQNFGEKTWQETFNKFEKTNDLKVFENALKSQNSTQNFNKNINLQIPNENANLKNSENNITNPQENGNDFKM